MADDHGYGCDVGAYDDDVDHDNDLDDDGAHDFHDVHEDHGDDDTPASYTDALEARSLLWLVHGRYRETIVLTARFLIPALAFHEDALS